MTAIPTVAPRAVVAAPTRAPFEYGLFSQVNFRNEPGTRWDNGVTWTGAPCTGVHGIDGRGCSETPISKTFDATASAGDGDVFVVYGHFTCSPVGTTPAEAEGRAREHLVQGEEQRVEQALWTGDLGNVPNFTGANGATAPTDLGTAGDAAVAVARLEAWLAGNAGARGMLHMGRGTASFLVGTGKIEARGGRLATKLGTPVVAGAGYVDGTIVATGNVTGYRGEPFGSTNRGGDLLDRRRNDLYAVAEREYVLLVDGCGMAKVTFDYDTEGETNG